MLLYMSACQHEVYRDVDDDDRTSPFVLGAYRQEEVRCRLFLGVLREDSTIQPYEGSNLLTLVTSSQTWYSAENWQRLQKLMD